MTAIVLTVTLSLSAYAPAPGSVMADGRRPHIGAYACPASVPLGSRVSVVGPARERALHLGLPVDGVCADRFHRRYSVGHLDICIPPGFLGLTDAQRRTLAFAWGRVRGGVVFYSPESPASP